MLQCLLVLKYYEGWKYCWVVFICKIQVYVVHVLAFNEQNYKLTQFVLALG